MKQHKVKKLVSLVTLSAITATTAIPAVTSVLAESPRATSSKASTNSTKRNVMYYGDWSVWGGEGNFYPKDIAADKLTHLNFAFMDFDASGNLVFTDKDSAIGNPVGLEGVQWDGANAGLLSAFQELRAKNPNLKIGVSVGGWSKSGDFSSVARDSQKRANFVKNIMKFIEYTNMDFVDIDWEYPASVRQPDLVDNKNDEGTPNSIPQDKENYTTLLSELKTALNAQGQKLNKTYELSVALPGDKTKMDSGLEIDKLFDIVDFANIMSYDLRGAWNEYSGHQTALYPNSNDPVKGNNLSIDEEVKHLISKGAPANKIVVGSAYYTRGWNKVEKGTDTKNPGLFQSASKTAKDADQTPSYGAPNESPLTSGDRGRQGGVWSYRNLSKLKTTYPGLKEYWDDTAKAPYLYDESTGMFFTFDNPKSIGEKTNYVNDNNLGGMIAWMASSDAPTTSSKRDELTTVAKKGLFGDAALPKHEIAYSPLDVSITLTPSADKTSYDVTVKNNEKLEETSVLLKQVERGSETIKAPKLYIKSDKAFTSTDYKAGTLTFKDGYTVVDLQSVWEGKTIEPGQSYSFKINGNGTISSVDLVQRMSQTSPDMYPQTIYTNSTEPVKNTAPVFSGVTPITINVGDKFDPLTGVTATDKEDGNLTSSIKVTGEVKSDVNGEYKLTYSVKDSKGLATTAERVVTVKEVTTTNPTEESNFGVGEGIQWPSQVNAPYADMTAWNTDEAFSNSGALNLKKIYEDTGVKYFNLGFIQAVSGTNNGKVNWGWGGFDVLSERHKDNEQYQGIKKSIKDIREAGGDVTISFGGLNGTAIWEATQDVDTMYNTYLEIVEGYGLTRIDLDIEGIATNKAHNVLNAKAIKKLQDKTGVDVVLTVSVLPTGLTNVQLDLLEAYLSQGVNLEVVNIMTMCYGNGTLQAGENYGTASLRAIDNTKNQIKDYYKKFANTTLTDAEAYRKVGTTSSIGFEGEAHPIFPEEWTSLVVNHAISKGIGMTSMWSINRDAMTDPNKGIKVPYGHTNLFKKFGDGTTVVPETPDTNAAPTLSGAKDASVNLNESFDPLKGVTASDKEDGDLTNDIKVTGEVKTSAVGKYTLTYTVTDSKGAQTTVKRVITVVDPSIIVDTYIPTKIYNVGEKVIFKGKEYTAKWWVQNEDPDKSGAWDKTPELTADGAIVYEPGMVFTGGQKVFYDGKVYEAKWWTNTTPGSDDTWKLIS